MATLPVTVGSIGAVPVRALRGATTVDEDTREAILGRVVELLGTMFERNGVEHDDLISLLFTATGDLHSAFPAAGARQFGLGDVPLLCAQELDIEGSTPRCIRLLVHLETDRTRADLRHVYLHGAVGLRDDLPS
jgi:chorismate mutase